MKTSVSTKMDSSEKRILRETEIENNKEVLRRYRKIKLNSPRLVNTTATSSSNFKSFKTYSNLKEKIEIKGIVKSLSFRELFFVFFLIFVPLGTLILNTLLKQNDEAFSNNLQIIKENTFNEPFFLYQGKTVDLQLEFLQPGIKALFADTISDEDGSIQVDPVLTIWKRPDEVIRIVDDIGPNSVSAAVILNINNEEDLLNYVAQISTVSSSQGGLFTFTVFHIEPTSLFPDTPVQFDFSGPGGRTGHIAALAQEQFYQIFAYSKNATLEDVLNTGIFVRSKKGSILATNFGSSVNDFSARLLFQAKESEDHIFEVDAIKDGRDTVIQEATLFYSVVSPTEIDLSTTSIIEGDILGALSKTYLITFEEEIEYEIVLESTFFQKFAQLINRNLTQKNVEIRLPRFPPSLTLQIQDPSNSEVLHRTKTEFDYEFSLEDGVVVMNPVNLSGTSLNFTSNLRNSLLLELFPTNPEYFSENFAQIIGSFNLSISPKSTQSLSKTAKLVDQNDPYSGCFENPLEVLAAGCSTGVYLYCRAEEFPFENIFDATLEEAYLVCICVGYMCQELHGSGSAADQTSGVSRAFDIFLLIVAIICLSIVCYLIYDYKMFFKRHRTRWKILYKVSWALSTFFFFILFIYALTRILLVNFFQDLKKLNEVFVGRQQNTFDEDDYLFYENSPFDELFSYLDGTLGIEHERSSSSNPKKFLTGAAQEFYDGITLDDRIVGDSFAFAQALKESIAIIQFIEISIAWVYVSFSASAVLRRKAQDQKKKLILYIRFIVGLNMLWYTIARFITFGRIYSNIFFYLYALTAGLVAALLFYVILLFRRAVILDRKFRTKMSSSTRSSNVEKRKKIEDVIKPIENAALTLICCVIGIAVANIYFGVNYTSRMERLRSRNENISKSFESFNDFCLIAGMISIFAYLVWSNYESKKILFEERSSRGAETRDIGRSSYLFRTRTKQTSSENSSSQKHFFSEVEKPQVPGQSFYRRFAKMSNAQDSSLHQTRVDAVDNRSKSVTPNRPFRKGISQVAVPTLGDDY
eukprot:snap_masked-scaffold_72-processed-gene-0.20-mRNA-1 protein AED:1.00 eAED:1.00 QI:0/0/0/0/1/1/12/0/1036